MAELTFRSRKKTNYTPASYTADETATVIGVNAYEIVGPVIGRVNVAFNGSGTAAILIVGDGGDTDRFGADGFVDETTAGNVAQGVGGSGSTYAAIGRHLYTSADTIDIGFTANTSGTRTTGSFDLFVWIARAIPN